MANGPYVAAAQAVLLSESPFVELLQFTDSDLGFRVPSKAKLKLLLGDIKRKREFGLARRFLEVVTEHLPSLIENNERLDENQLEARAEAYETVRRYVGQQLALCTYKDTSLRIGEALDQAEKVILQLGAGALEDPETCGIAGSIFKRRWQAERQLSDLEKSLQYYRRGMARATDELTDQGYNALNAAFVLDLMAADEEGRGMYEVSTPKRIEAVRIRRKIIEKLPPQVGTPPQWWEFATLLEAHFGVGEYEQAQALFGTYHPENPPTWEFDSTAQQLGTLACLHEYGQDVKPEAIKTRTPFLASEQGLPEWMTAASPHERRVLDKRMRRVIHTLLGDQDSATDERALLAIDSALRGKVGLALSGGGFRASLYHIGVLARLAEIDALRHVEVLSCVSGGSILGAYYYLKLQHLLETTSNHDIRKEHYITLVQEMERDFLEGIQKNIRTRIVASFPKNVRMLFSAKYSRTIRGGELMDKYLFSKIPLSNVPRPPGDPPARASRVMWNLAIYPKDAWIYRDQAIPAAGDNDWEFRPGTDNWYLSAKVPMLVLNATTMNTCHQWQFTASFMGEPPAGASSKIDGNPRLRRLYYREKDLKKEFREFRLSDAVAASAAVPGLFEPVAIPGLYPNFVVRLSDGGVFDNQGAASLLEQDCTVALVSDASGHQGTEPIPGSSPLSNLLRSNSVSLARVREAQFMELAARERSSLLRGMMFIHLRQDLEPRAVRWEGGELNAEEVFDDRRAQARESAMTTFGINKKAQDLIARVRTDLDTFCEIEAYSIMFSGYQMAKEKLKGLESVFPGMRYADILQPPNRWKFMQIQNELGERKPDAPESSTEEVLRVAGGMAFKVWQLYKPLKYAGTGLAVVGLFFALLWLGRRFNFDFTLGPVAVTMVVTTGAGGLVSGLNKRAWAALVAGGVLMAVGVAAAMLWKEGAWDRMTAMSVVAMALLTAVGGAVLGSEWAKVLRPMEALRSILVRLGFATVGWVAANIHLLIFDPLYKRIGSLPKKRKVKRA